MIPLRILVLFLCLLTESSAFKKSDSNVRSLLFNDRLVHPLTQRFPELNEFQKYHRFKNVQGTHIYGQLGDSEAFTPFEAAVLSTANNAVNGAVIVVVSFIALYIWNLVAMEKRRLEDQQRMEKRRLEDQQRMEKLRLEDKEAAASLRKEDQERMERSMLRTTMISFLALIGGYLTTEAIKHFFGL
eukprot:CAMPEP_0174958106 /NCGR_PEP_ID=MMETSP0004_2-20121128/2443_1 /TAXON_ID=420556 /ORGANISM="Ochromonas sp., Strain CCMP1393" /LENGTH=185 /DNA_ID=CAMNT_0016206289 /DNA_START=187 /DNA_END=744 /DNA_ORIENTATION=-